MLGDWGGGTRSMLRANRRTKVLNLIRLLGKKRNEENKVKKVNNVMVGISICFNYQGKGIAMTPPSHGDKIVSNVPISFPEK